LNIKIASGEIEFLERVILGKRILDLDDVQVRKALHVIDVGRSSAPIPSIILWKDR